MTHPSRDDRLRALLRDADPAAGAPPLPPADLAHIRQAASAALAAPARSLGWRPFAWAATAAVVLLALGFAIAGRQERVAPAPQVAAAAPVQSSPRPVAGASSAAMPAVPAAAAATLAAEAAPRATRHPSRPASGRATAPLVGRQRLAASPSAAAAATVATVTTAPPRQIQLTTPGGTRIVWVLESSPGR